MEHCLQGIHHVAAGPPGVGLKAEEGVVKDEGVGDGAAVGQAAAEQQAAQQPATDQGGGVGKRVVVGEAGLGQAADLEGVFIMQGGQDDRQVAHHGTVAGIAVARRPGEGTVGHVAADATPAGVAAIHGFAAQPGHVGFGHGLHAPAVGVEDGLAESQAHGGVVGDLAGGQLEPAATGHVTVHAVLGDDLPGGHELGGGAQGVADGQAQVGAEGLVAQAAGVQAGRQDGRMGAQEEGIKHSGPPLRIRRRSPAPRLHRPGGRPAAGRERTGS